MMSSNIIEPLRKNWIQVIIEDVVENRKEKTMPDQLPNAKYIGMDCMAPNAIRPSFFHDFSDYKSAGNVFEFGDVLYGRLRPYLNKVHSAESEGVCSGEFIVLIPSSILHSKYLLYNLHSKAFVDFANHQVTGERPRISFNKMSKYCINLPSLPEQGAIVSKIEQLFSDLDNGIDNFKKAQAQLKLYRQSVLKAACEGRLVPTEAELARAKGRDYEAADVLLARILKERRENWNGRGKYKELAVPDMSELSELPEGWIWSIFGLVFNVSVGATPSRKRQDYWGGQIPWVSSGEVAFCKIFKTKEMITNMGLTNSSTVVHPQGTVLLGMIGEGKTRGQAAILEIAACNNQNSAAIRVSEIGLPPEYIFYFLEGDYEHTRTIGSGNNQQALNKSRVQSMFFPLPPLAEQHRIITEVECLLSICDKMEETIAESLQKAESLRQSILKKAFEGKLLNEKELEEARNAPDWEPAEKLLEKIKAEKTNTKAKKKGKK